MKKLFLFLACGLFVGNIAMAQSPKLGYINSGELLAAMPERAKADTAVQQYAKQFQEQIETMTKDYQSKVQQFQGSEKTMTDAIKEVKMKEIQDLQNRIESTQQSAQEKNRTKETGSIWPYT